MNIQVEKGILRGLIPEEFFKLVNGRIQIDPARNLVTVLDHDGREVVLFLEQDWINQLDTGFFWYQIGVPTFKGYTKITPYCVVSFDTEGRILSVNSRRYSLDEEVKRVQ